VLAKHIADFGRYPSPRARSFRARGRQLAFDPVPASRPIDPESEILVLSGSREGLFFAAITAARYVGPRKGRPAILMPNLFYPAYGRGRPRRRLRTDLPADHARQRILPDLDALDDATLARTVAIFTPRPPTARFRRSRDYFIRLKKLADRHGFMVLSDECYSEIYTRQRRQRAECAGPLHQRRCVPVAVEALEPAWHARRLAVMTESFSQPSRIAHRQTAGAGAAAARRRL
jgi:aspartate/methionine/tyrosine aminotransferase